MLRWLFKQVNCAGLPRDRDRWIDGENERREKESAKERQRESDGARRDGNRGWDEEMHGGRRVWPLIRGTMGSVQSNQSRTELYSRLGPQWLTKRSQVHCPLLIDHEGRTNL